MAVKLNITPTARGTAVVRISLTTEGGTPRAFGDIMNPQWQLMREGGIIVNDRSFINSNMDSLEVTLTGDDLVMFSARDTGKRVFSFQAQYNSKAGLNLNATAEAKFTIEDLMGQPYKPR